MPKNFQQALLIAKDSGLLQELAIQCTSLSEIALKLGYSSHGRNTKAVRDYLKTSNIEFHTTSVNGNKSIFGYKICLNCGKEFEVILSNKRSAKILTCSYKCSNTYAPFQKVRVNNKVGEPTTYQVIAKNAGLTSCCICGESEVLDIHHFDNDRGNNELSNLVPLCPTHHAYLHRNKSDLIYDKLIHYMDNRQFI